MSTPSQQFEKINEDFLADQRELQKLIQSRETLAIQETENKVVKDEFDSIEDEDTPIYKQIGPVLVPQTKAEAEMNVDKRLEFIRAEIKRVEDKIAEKQKSSEEKPAATPHPHSIPVNQPTIYAPCGVIFSFSRFLINVIQIVYLRRILCSSTSI
ncbi:similar to Saccharomyces cerevisiae YLR200W YKE2 Subunit of the heterohexameric Gim/prefoldin protein complex involved in the folding of alpha-tubulin [Geotrichum candidum]|uniref:Similar to Saccharomyces cerevisiae YLR200W YKE2 Subunit of the heterohexameric Gim/prefoldin protein complex involved in the folding of alpha-tubulin n=1 Tax=Geotrichum candidum TaxID=1173061 RepID=A0A0J9XIP2_GEOCN|nr:similar to Saccharomyces cerevisiae YLR200W YKE2 Subunit of the heterohexameric Gim/prefoldin protein complex involved in the folding of alpha-tubulin [Geotrichum candidum]